MATRGPAAHRDSDGLVASPGDSPREFVVEVERNRAVLGDGGYHRGHSVTKAHAVAGAQPLGRAVCGVCGV